MSDDHPSSDGLGRAFFEAAEWIGRQFAEMENRKAGALLFRLRESFELPNGEWYRGICLIGGRPAVEEDGTVVKTGTIRFSSGESEQACDWSCSVFVAPSGRLFHLIEQRRTAAADGSWRVDEENFFCDPVLTEPAIYQRALARLGALLWPAAKVAPARLALTHPLVHEPEPNIRFTFGE